MTVTTASRGELLALCRRIADEYPTIAGGLVDRHLDDDASTWHWAQKALGYLQDRHPEGLDTVVEGFAVVSIDFLRLQARFMRTGRYARQESTDLSAELYDDPEKMRGYYLDGLAATYALWPNHARMLESMATRFLGNLPTQARVVEVGVGHGLMASLLLEAVPGSRYLGVDISQSSLDYTGGSLADQQVPADRWSMVHADAMSGALVELAGATGFDGLLCCEVLEHVDTPERLLRSLRDAVDHDGRGFVSTVANMEAEDHVYLFHDVAHIERTVTDAGWVVDSALADVLPGAQDWSPLPVNYSAVLLPGPTR